MPVGIEFADLRGVLGPGSADRLGRVIFAGLLAAGTSITLPGMNYDVSNMANSNGAIFSTDYPARLIIPDSTITWNNTTKVLTAISSYNLVVIAFRGATAPAGGVGVVINNSGGEVIIDNVNPNLEVLAKGSIACNAFTVYSLPTEANFNDSFVFLRWPIGNSLCRGAFRQFVTFQNITVEYIIARINPVFSCISGGLPGLCLQRGSDGLVLFDSKREYARMRSMIFFENLQLVFDGGFTSASIFSHNDIPSTAYFRLERAYRIGTSKRILITTRLNTVNWATFPGDTDGFLSNAQIDSLNLFSVGPGFPGPVVQATLIADP